MALDQIPYTQQQMRNKILRNIGHAFMLMGQYDDAISSYEHVLESRPTKELDGGERKVPGRDFPTAFNTLLCYFAIGDRDMMKRGFLTVLQQELSSQPEDDRYQNFEADEHVKMVLEVVKHDVLSQSENAEKATAEKLILSAAKLISPAIESTFAAGYDWCTDQIRQSPYAWLAPELEITKAISYLKVKEFKSAIKTLKKFERDDSRMQSAAA